jgi:hypothetical protein
LGSKYYSKNPNPYPNTNPKKIICGSESEKNEFGSTTLDCLLGLKGDGIIISSSPFPAQLQLDVGGVCVVGGQAGAPIHRALYKRKPYGTSSDGTYKDLHYRYPTYLG